MNKVLERVVDGCKILVLFSAVALVVWHMPDHGPAYEDAVIAQLTDQR